PTLLRETDEGSEISLPGRWACSGNAKGLPAVRSSTFERSRGPFPSLGWAVGGAGGGGTGGCPLPLSAGPGRAGGGGGGGGGGMGGGGGGGADGCALAGGGGGGGARGGGAAVTGGHGAVPGTLIRCVHFGHATAWPAMESGHSRGCRQPGQAMRIGMGT